MSFSFSARGATKSAAIAAVAEAMAAVVKDNGLHAFDEQLARAAIRAYIDLLAVDLSRDIRVTVSGAIQIDDARGVVQAGLSIEASMVDRVAPATPAAELEVQP